MKKIMKRVLPLALSLLTIGSTAACGGGGNNGGGVDADKTQLYVYCYGGGVGSQWIRKVKTRFESDFADYEFEPDSGKKGVEIVIDDTKDDASLQTITASSNNVFFTEWVDIPALNRSKNTIDISDLVTTPLNTYLEGKTTDTTTIESKLYDETKEFFTFMDADKDGKGEYYGLPHYSHFPSVIYNRQLFDDNKWYFAETPTGTTLEEQFISDFNAEKSCGPDGVSGTDDDGLPATWDEMWMLCEYITTYSAKPFLWNSASAKGYTKYLLSAAYTNLVGQQKASYNYSGDSGEDTINVVKTDANGNLVFDANGKVEYTTATIDPEGDYRKVISSELEKYYAIELYDKVLDTAAWQHDECNLGADYLQVQGMFVKSRKSGNTPTAMLLEGSYWYNECEETGTLMDAKYGYDNFEEENKFEMMALPHVYNGRASDVKASAPQGGYKRVITDQSDSFACINANIASDANRVKLAKMFLAYCYTQESLEEFTIETDCARLMKYDVDTTKLSTYGKHVWDTMKNADILLPYSNHEIYTSNKRMMTMHIDGTFFEYPTSSVGGTRRPLELLGENGDAATYFANYIKNRMLYWK